MIGGITSSRAGTSSSSSSSRSCLSHRSSSSSSSSAAVSRGASSTVVEPDAELLAELRYLECEALRLCYREFVAEHHGAAASWLDFKAKVDAAAGPVDPRVRPIYASLTLGFVSQGIQFPVLPQLARSLGLGTADLGFATACTSCARLLANIPATWAAERLGRRPMLMCGPSVAGVGMLGLANASCFEHLILSNVCVGTGLATTMAGASLYLADVSTPKNRAQSTAPLLQSALLGFAIGPAIGGVLAQYAGMHLPFVACAGGLFASSAASAFLLPETMHEVARRRERQERLVRGEKGDADAAAGADVPPPPAAAADGAAAAEGAAAADGAADGARPAPASSWWQPPAVDEASLRLLRRPALQGLGGAIFMNGFSQGAFPVTLVLFAVEHMQMSSSAVGGMLTLNVLGMVLTTTQATKLSDRMTSRKALMVPAMAAAAVFTALQPFSHDAWQFAGLLLGASLMQAVSMPSISPLILDCTTADERARALAGRQIVLDLGGLLGAGSMGLLASHHGIPVAMETVAALQALSVVWFAARVPGGKLARGGGGGGAAPPAAGGNGMLATSESVQRPRGERES